MFVSERCRCSAVCGTAGWQRRSDSVKRPTDGVGLFSAHRGLTRVTDKPSTLTFPRVVTNICRIQRIMTRRPGRADPSWPDPTILMAQTWCYQRGNSIRPIVSRGSESTLSQTVDSCWRKASFVCTNAREIQLLSRHSCWNHKTSFAVCLWLWPIFVPVSEAWSWRWQTHVLGLKVRICGARKHRKTQDDRGF